ncbi:MAG: hypothetical protein SPL37_06590 [Prevotella sp.]|nr:hypothetical protein [Prevotella sp.]
MKYQITCNHCGTRFLVDGKGGQTIECTCPGCEGKLRVTLPKTKKDADNDSYDANDGYQQGYVPAGNGDDNYGNEDGDNGDNGKRHRRMALGCLFFIVVAAAAAVAFFALNHTTKQPIEDPYENVEPDTTSVDTIPEDTEDVVVDTVQVHEEKPKEEAAPKDTATVVATPDDGDGADVSQQSSDASSDVTGKSSGKDHHGSAAEQSAKEDKTSKSSKKSSASSSSSNE